MRKIYLDNIRWCTIILVVFFHVFFFFNNIGITAIFEGLPEYHHGDGMIFTGVYQYAVYPWFMTLLFEINCQSVQRQFPNGKQLKDIRISHY